MPVFTRRWANQTYDKVVYARCDFTCFVEQQCFPLGVSDATNYDVCSQLSSWKTTVQLGVASGPHSSRAAHRYWCSRLSATRCRSPSPSNTNINTTAVGVEAAASAIQQSLTTTITTTRHSHLLSLRFWEQQRRGAALLAISWGVQVTPSASTKSSTPLPRRTIFSEICPSRGVLIWLRGVCILQKNVHDEAE
jgi:hypothetical protein